MTQPNDPMGEPAQFPPPVPGDPFAPDLNYQGNRPYGAAPTLVKVVGIMNIVTAGIDILWCGLLSVFAIMFGTGNLPKEFQGPEGPLPPGASLNLVALVLCGMALLSVVAGVLKLIGGIKLLRKSRGAWGFGLAGGIIGCVQLWCSYFCVLPMGVGIFTIVVMALGNTRRYLSDHAVGVDSQGPLDAAGPIA